MVEGVAMTQKSFAIMMLALLAIATTIEFIYGW